MRRFRTLRRRCLAQRKWLAVIGSAGQPRDGNPAASFAIYDTDDADADLSPRAL